MSNNIAPITFIDGELTKKYQRIIVTGEVYRAKVHEKALKPEDKAYEISVKIPKEQFIALKSAKMDTTDKDGNVTVVGNRTLAGIKKVALKVRDEEGNETYDEEGDVVKEFSHFQLTMRQNRAIKGEPLTIPVAMAADNTPVLDFLNEGTEVSVLAQAYESEYAGKFYIGLNLKEVKVHKLVAYEGGSGGAATDPWAALGMTAAVVEKTEQAAPQTPSQSAPAEVPELPESPQEVDFDDDIPF